MTVAPSKPSPAPRVSHQARLIRLSAVAMSFLLAAFATVTTSRAAFNTTTSNSGSTASTATIALTDDDSATAMFTLTNLVPGQAQTKCIVVTYTGNLPPAPVKVYRSAVVTGTGLDQYLDMTIEAGTSGTFSNCTGFTGSSIYSGTMQNFMTTYQGWSTGLSTAWTPSATPQTRTFRVTLTLQDNNAAQGKSVGFGFTWEAQL
jgi:hypothetical protein